MLCGRCLMCQVLVLSLPFFISLSYSLQQSKKKRGRQRKVGFLLSGIITKEALIPCIFINRWGCDYVFLHPSFSSVFLEREMGNKTAAEPGNQSRAPSRQPSNCHLPPPQIASLPPLLPSRYLAGFSESERTADNCLCASCCTCHQPAIETLIIFLIIAKRLVFLPLSSLEEEKKKKKKIAWHMRQRRDSVMKSGDGFLKRCTPLSEPITKALQFFLLKRSDQTLPPISVKDLPRYLG